MIIYMFCARPGIYDWLYTKPSNLVVDEQYDEVRACAIQNGWYIGPTMWRPYKFELERA